MDVKLALSQMIGQQQQQAQLGQQQDDLHEKELLQKQKLCMEILNVANKISPGDYDGFFYNVMMDRVNFFFR